MTINMTMTVQQQQQQQQHQRQRRRRRTLSSSLVLLSLLVRMRVVVVVVVAAIVLSLHHHHHHPNLVPQVVVAATAAAAADIDVAADIDADTTTINDTDDDDDDNTGTSPRAANNNDQQHHQQHRRQPRSFLEEPDDEPFRKTCRLYMAPSSIEGAGYGIFTTEALQEGDYVARFDGPNIAVIVDTSSVRRRKQRHSSSILDLWHNVWWGTHGGMSHHMMYEIPPVLQSKNYLHVYDYQITFGALPNFHPFQSNLEHVQPDLVYDDDLTMSPLTCTLPHDDDDDDWSSLLHPGAGAFSYYRGKHFLVHTSVQAGGEIFLNYGPQWLRRNGGTSMAHIPRRRDYYTAAEILRRVFVLTVNVGGTGDGTGVDDDDDESISLLHRLLFSQSPGNDDHDDDTKNQAAAAAAATTTTTAASASKSPEELALQIMRATLSAMVGFQMFKDDAESNDDYPEYRVQRVMSLIPNDLEKLRKVLQVANRTMMEEADEDEQEQDEEKEEETRMMESENDSEEEYEDEEELDDKQIWQHHLAEAIYTEVSMTRRSPEFVRQHGMCLDHIVPRTSTLPLAGMGAIAQRPLSKGERIVPVPLLHMPDRALLTRSSLNPNYKSGDKNGTATSKIVYKEELLVNYCFGHDESTLLLCPVTNAVLINHCSNRTQEHDCGQTKGPNAKVQWAIDWDPTTPQSLMETLEEIGKSTRNRKLSMEVIALRDIAEGEEIFIDYGASWEKAWEEHVKNWVPPPDHMTKDTASDNGSCSNSWNEVKMNALEDLSPHFGDLRSVEPYVTENGRFMTMCWNDYGSTQEDRWRDNTTDWKTMKDADILEQHGIDGSHVIFINGEKGDWWPCSLIAKTEDDDDYNESYIVRLFWNELLKEPEWHRRGLPRIYRKFPRSSIRFFTMPWNSDQHLPLAFRHPIGIPDDIFPTQWKNKNASSASGR